MKTPSESAVAQVATGSEDPAIEQEFGVLIRRLELGAAVRKFLRVVGQPPFYIAQRCVSALTRDRLRLGRHYFMALGRPPSGDAARPGLEIRLATEDDFASAGSSSTPLTRGRWQARLAAGDECLIAADHGEIVGYNWFATRPLFEMDECRFVVGIPDSGAYSYDVYVRESHRRLGVWRLLQVHLLEAILRPRGRTILLSAIEYGNDRSVAAHLRVGYVHFMTLRTVFFRGRAFNRLRPMDLRRDSESLRVFADDCRTHCQTHSEAEAVK
ncbi:MAG TPA: GNAT family N-acetyltransferase [Vicinamibacterales bacterium]|jgi:GNAT superfamily N-acetyltransferase